MWIFNTRGAVRYQYLYSTHPSWYIYPVHPIQSHSLFMCVYIYVYIRSLSCSFRSYPVLYSILSHPSPSPIWHIQALIRFTFPKRWNQEFKDSVFDALNLALHRDFHSAVVFCSHLLHSYVSILTKPSFFQNELLDHHGRFNKGWWLRRWIHHGRSWRTPRVLNPLWISQRCCGTPSQIVW